MRYRRLVTIIATLLGLIGIFKFNSQPANASYLNGNDYAKMATRYVRVTKSMPVYRCKTGNCEANNRFHRYGTLKKGTKVYISRWLMSTGSCWVIKSHKYYHNRRTFFAGPGMKVNWYKRIR